MTARLLAAVLVTFSIFAPVSAIHQNPKQQPIQGPSTQPRRVAIIGAGAAGSSTAYHLQKYSANYTIPLSITIFESSSKIGGRSTTIDAFDNPEYPTEIGGSIFAVVNHILVDAAREFSLITVGPSANSPKQNKYDVGIWDGREFVYKSTRDDGWQWWMDMAKLFWRYGLAPLKTQNLMKTTVAQFLDMYEEPLFPWRNLTEVVNRTGLLDTTAKTGRQLLQDNGIGEKFGREVIQASTRVNYGQNLGLIHGLETMVCMATDGAMSVEGGNWRIFDGMVKRSHAEVRINTSVEEVVRVEDGGYRLLTTDTKEAPQTKETFDTVVIAAPLQYSGIKISPLLPHSPDEIPYVTLHVTILASPYRPSTKFFSTSSNHEDEASIPSMIITTLPPDLDLDLGSSPHGVGPTNFWSISTLRTVQVNNSEQYLYKIFSPEPLTATFLSQLFDFSLTDSEPLRGDISSIGKDHISWSYEKVWHSYPYEYPRVTFEELNLDGEGLWYTAGMESFISTMETSALMGKNVARLIVDGMM